EQELLHEHGEKWLPSGIGGNPCAFRRGFVEEITLTPEEFLTSASWFFGQTPIRELCLRQRKQSHADSDRSDSPVVRLAQSPLLARLDGLDLQFPVGRYAAQALIESPHLEGLRRLRLSGNLDGNPLVIWGTVPRGPRLRHLDLSNCLRISSAVLRTLVEMPHLAQLTHLNLAQTSLTLDDLRYLVHSPRLASLRVLNLNGNRLTHKAVSVLAEGTILSSLERLWLEANLLGDAGAIALLEWPALPRLTSLSLAQNQIFASGMKAVAESPALRELVSLNLSRNVSCDEGVVALAFSSWTRLQGLNLWFNGIGDKGIRALASSEGLSQLTRLNLTANSITNSGARRLIEASGLPRLSRLDLLRNDIGEAEQQRLRDRFGPFVYC
ncbi:MAG TPA: hypothetical protein VH592_25000, partial [Gemmataceae bacterium]